MNKGLIVGKVFDRSLKPAKKAVVRLLQFEGTHREVSLFNVDGTKRNPNTIGYANKHGRFAIRFRWEGGDVGHTIGGGSLFTVAAFHSQSNHKGKGKGTGRLLLGPSLSDLLAPIDHAMSGGLKAFRKDFAAAFTDALRVPTSSAERVLFGYSDVFFDSK